MEEVTERKTTTKENKKKCHHHYSSVANDIVTSIMVFMASPLTPVCTNRASFLTVS